MKMFLALLVMAISLVAAPALAMTSAPTVDGALVVARADYTELDNRLACAVKLHTDPKYQATNWVLLNADYKKAEAVNPADVKAYAKEVGGFNGRMKALGYACPQVRLIGA